MLFKKHHSKTFTRLARTHIYRIRKRTMSNLPQSVFLVLLALASCKARSLDDYLNTAVAHDASFQILNSRALAPKQHQVISPFTNSTPACGRVFTEDKNDLLYKPFDQVFENERCVWIIAVPENIEYNVTLAYMSEEINQPGSGQELLFTGIGYPESARDPVINSYRLTSPGTIQIKNTSIILVTFISGENPGTGFFLGYKAIKTSYKQVPSRESTSHILGGSTLDFRYPLGSGRNYYDNELAAFVLPPSNNLFSGSSHKLWFKVHELESEYSCYDVLNVYKFNARAEYSDEKWEHDRMICGRDTTGSVQADDFILVIFLSDQSERRSGFSLSNLGC